MLTTFVYVKKEYFSLDAKMVETAKETLILEHAVLRTNDEEKYELYIDTYHKFNALLKRLIKLNTNNLILWRVKGRALQIYVMDYFDDNNVYQVLHYPVDGELEANDKRSLIGSSLEITTFDEFAEEATNKELEDLLMKVTVVITDTLDPKVKAME